MISKKIKICLELVSIKKLVETFQNLALRETLVRQPAMGGLRADWLPAVLDCGLIGYLL